MQQTDGRPTTEHLPRTRRNKQPLAAMIEESYTSQPFMSGAWHPGTWVPSFQVDILLGKGSILPVLEVDANSMRDTELSLLRSGCLNLGPQGIVVISCPCAVQDGITGQKAQRAPQTQ